MNRIYRRLPYFLQNMAISVFGFFNDKKRFGIEFERFLKEYSENNNRSLDEIMHIRATSLSRFLKHSNKSLFWHNRFAKYDVDLNGDPLVQIKKLPLLTKSEVQENLNDIKISVAGLRPISTSGSTGSGLAFWGNESSEAAQWAIWWRYWGRFGINRGTWCAHFGGKMIVPILRRKPPYYRLNLASKQMMFSAYHLSETTVFDYIQALNKKRILWLHGYASVITELARLAIQTGAKLDYQVKYISLGSENVTSSHQRVIFEFFGIKPIQHYGLAEGVANFSAIPNKEGLVVDEDFSYVEFLPVGEQFKIIGTNFTNYAFPLIRYDTSDLASGVNIEVFPRTVGNIDGRQDDYIKLPTGERIGRLASLFNQFDFIDESQIVQRKLNMLEINIVKNWRWTENSEALVLAAMREKLGHVMQIHFVYSSAIKRTASGKIRFVISEV
ncbi:phenylacetate--CoA ligase family protein [Alcaligenaceae bacterium]|nr:phenylacetate--CoA ligase family protein [Alcaligenaceae bacterium]